MIRKAFEIEVSDGNEAVKVEASSSGDVDLTAGGLVVLTAEEAREVAQCLLTVADDIDPPTTFVLQKPTYQAPPGKPGKSVLEYGDGGKLNPQ